MDINQIAKSYIDTNRLATESAGTFRKGDVDRSYRFYHVIQQTYNGRRFFTSPVAAYYHSCIVNQCPAHNVVLLCQVVMPTHTHEIFYTEDMMNISRMRANACRATTMIVKKELRAKGYSIPERVFQRFPGYVPIRSGAQMLYTLKYIRDNDLYLKAADAFAPYSCFKYWEKGYFKGYCMDMLEEVIGIKTPELLALIGQDKKEVKRIAKTLDDRHPVFRQSLTELTERT